MAAIGDRGFFRREYTAANFLVFEPTPLKNAESGAWFLATLD